jgi:predicted transcriptional regulator
MGPTAIKSSAIARSILVAMACPSLTLPATEEKESPMSDENSLSPVELATEITVAWLNNPNNRTAAEDVPAFLRAMHATVAELAVGVTAPSPEATPAAEEFVPAVSVRRSLASKDHILSLIDGKPYKTLTRHLTGHGLTPAEYRRRYNLRSDYPMVSETYSQSRREMARRIGLGRRPTTPVQSAPVTAAPAAVKKAAAPKAAAPKAAAQPKAASTAPAATETV